MRAHQLSITVVSIHLLLSVVTAAAEGGPPSPPTGSWSQPVLDRWFYPFNATPGTRQTASVFGSTPGDSLFDSRDGQFYFAFDTADQIPTDWSGAAWRVAGARVTIMVSNDVAAYDNSADPWQCFVGASDADWQADADAGQPVELFAAGYRNGWTPSSMAENGPFANAGDSVLVPEVRNVFAAEAFPGGFTADCSNHPREDRDARSLAIGSCATVSPGDILSNGSTITFEIPCDLPENQDYLALALQAGRVPFIVSSLTFVVQGGGNFPSFYTRENPLVILGAASAPTLEIELGLACAPADIDCSGAVNGADLAALLGNWGQPGPTDINDSGQTDGGDLALLLGAWE